jgi:TRAP-type uncharacterized transport system substrate-binding protein
MLSVPGQRHHEVIVSPAVIGIAAGPLGSPEYSIGEGLAGLMIERFHNDDVTPEGRIVTVAAATTGSGENVALIAQAQARRVYSVSVYKPPLTATFCIGFMNSLIPPLLPPDQLHKLRGVAVLWDEYLHLVVNPAIGKHIHRLSDLKQLADQQKSRGGSKLRIYLSPRDSITRQVAVALLADIGLTKTDYQDAIYRRQPHFPPLGVDEAAATLTTHNKAEQIDAAFIFSGLPNPAVETALSKGCKLVPVVGWTPKEEKLRPAEHLSPTKEERFQDALKVLNRAEMTHECYIPAQTYRGVTWDIPTLSGKVLLVASRDLEPKLVRSILSAIFDAQFGVTGQQELVGFHEVAAQIRLFSSLELLSPRRPDRLAQLLPLHPGAQAFWEAEQRKLKIAAGPLEGTSFHLGVTLADSLERNHIPARAVNTNGSWESLSLLRAKKVDLALLHNDVLSTGYESGAPVRLISVLYPEAVHVLAVRLPPEHLKHCIKREPKDFQELLQLLVKRIRLETIVWALPDDLDQGLSGLVPLDRESQIVQIYDQLLFGGDRLLPHPQRLSISEMQTRLLSGHLAAAIVTAGVPMEAVQQLVAPSTVPRLLRLSNFSQWCPYCGERLSPTERLGVRLLPLSSPARSDSRAVGGPQQQPDIPDNIQGLVANNRFLQPFTISPSTYPSAQRGRVDTVAVEIALACRPDCEGVGAITGALIDDEVYLRSVAKEINLRDPLPRSVPVVVPLHPDARQYFQQQHILPTPVPKPGVIPSWAIQSLLTTVIAAFVGFVFRATSLAWKKLNRRRVEFEERIRSIYYSVGVSNKVRLQQLEDLRQEISADYGKGLTPQQTDALDTMLRDYRDRLPRDSDVSGGYVAP